MQKGVFYKPICNYLILQRLQRRFFSDYRLIWEQYPFNFCKGISRQKKLRLLYSLQAQ